MCFACIAATRAGSPACYNDIQEAAAERALAFAHRVTAKTIPIRLVDYGNVVTDTRETELADIVKRTFKAVAPDGSDVEVTQWHSENKKSGFRRLHCVLSVPRECFWFLQHGHSRRRL